MTVRAMSFLRICTTNSTIRVITSSHQTQVIRIDATGIAADMVNGHASGNVSNEKHVRNPMSHLSMTSSEFATTHPAVSSLLLLPHPYQAIRIAETCNLSSPPINEWFRRSSSKFSIADKPLSISHRPISGGFSLSVLGIGHELAKAMRQALNRLVARQMPLAIKMVAQRVHVIRVNAAAVIANVVKFCSTWNKAHENLERYLVSVKAAVHGLKLTVSFPGKTCGPIPASGLRVQFELRHETLKNWAIGWHNEIFQSKQSAVVLSI